jgi:hypothetical protein
MEEVSSVYFSSLTASNPPSGTRSTGYLPQGKSLSVAAYGVEGAEEQTAYTQLKSYTVTDEQGGLSAGDGNPMLLRNRRSYAFYAFSPSLSIGNGIRTVTIDQGADFIFNYSGSTYVSGITTTVTFPALEHQCSDLQFTLQIDPSNQVVTSLSPGSQGLTLQGLPHSPRDYVLGSGFTSGSGANDGSAQISGSGFTDEGGQTHTAHTVVLPREEASGFTLTMHILINDISSTATAVIPPMAFVPGVRYLFTISFTDSKVNLLLRIVPWNENSSTVDAGGAWGVISVGQWDLKATDHELGQPQVVEIVPESWDASATFSDEVGVPNKLLLEAYPWSMNANPQGNMGVSSPLDPADGDWVPVNNGSTTMGQ